MPSLSATITANADPMLRELRVVQAASARTGAAVKRNLQGGSVHSGRSGVITETLVLMREMSRGNWSRVPGSLTILVQRLGLLKLLFKDSAEGAKALAAAMEAKAAVSLAEAQRLKDIADRGTQAIGTMRMLSEAEMLAAAQDRARAAAAGQAALADQAEAAAAREAAIALEAKGAAAGFAVGPVGWLAIGVVALGVSAYFAVRHLITLRREAENLADLMDTTNASFTDQASALREAARAAQEFDDWLKKLHESESDFADSVHETLDAMRERARLEHELAADKGASKRQLAQMDIDALRKEKDFLDKSIAAAKEKQAKDEADAKSAARDANSPEREATIKTASQRAEEAAKIADVVRERMKHTSQRGEIIGTGLEGVPIYGPDRASNENDKMTGIKIGEKIYPDMSLKEAEANMKKLNDEVIELIATQKKLADLEHEKERLSEKDKETLKNLTKTRDKIVQDLGLKGEFLPQIADAKGHKMVHGSVNELQRVGAYAAPSILANIAKQSLHEQREIKQLVGKLANGKMSGPRF